MAVTLVSIIYVIAIVKYPVGTHKNGVF